MLIKLLKVVHINNSEITLFWNHHSTDFAEISMGINALPDATIQFNLDPINIFLDILERQNKGLKTTENSESRFFEIEAIPDARLVCL